MTVMHGDAGIERPKSGHCHYCGKEVFKKDHNRLLTWDHVVPKSRGGLNIRANLVVSCQGCNLTKGALLLDEYRTLKTLQYMSTRVLGVRILKMKFAGERTAYAGRPVS